MQEKSNLFDAIKEYLDKMYPSKEVNNISYFEIYLPEEDIGFFNDVFDIYAAIRDGLENRKENGVS